MSEPISASLRAIQRIGAEGFAGTALASDVGPTVRRVGRRRVGRVVGAGLAAVVLVATVTVGALAYSGRTVSPALPSETPYPSAERVLVVVKLGDTATDVAEALETAGIIAAAQDFVDEASADPASAAQIGPGRYWLPRGASASDALAAMLDPSKRQAPNLVIQPGLTKQRILYQIEDTFAFSGGELYRAIRDPASIGLPAEANGDLDGWMGSYAYYFADDATATEVLSGLVSATLSHLDERGVAPSDRQRVLTEASLIEQLTTIDAERSKVARVIENRLAADLPLQYSPGIAMKPDEDGTWVAVIDAEGNSPDATYPDPGLPPTPICSPSIASIDAAVHPADGPWLYLVPGFPGTEATRFAATLEEHKQNLAELVAWMQASMIEDQAQLEAEVARLDAMDAAGA